MSVKLSITLDPTVGYSFKDQEANKSLDKTQIDARLSSFSHLNRATKNPIEEGKQVSGMLGENFFAWLQSRGAGRTHSKTKIEFSRPVVNLVKDVQASKKTSQKIAKIATLVKFIFLFKWVKKIDTTREVEFTKRVIGLVKDLQTDKEIAGSTVKFSGAYVQYLDVKMLKKAGIEFKIAAPQLKYGPPPKNPDQQKRIQAWRQAIPDVLETCKDLPCWLEGGSLLGAMRNGDVIPYDNSAYVSFMQDDFDQVEKKMQELVRQKPGAYQLENWSKDGEKTFLRLKLLQTGRYVDLYFYKEDPKDNKKIQWIDPHPDTHPFKQWQPSFDRSLIFPLATVDFQGRQLPAPAKTRDYLLLRYGDLRPTHHYDPATGEYKPTTGTQFIQQQQALIKRHLPKISDDQVATFEGPHANLPLGFVPEAQKQKHEKWAAMISQMNDLLQKVGIDYWVDAGTLLGAYRHGAIIPWDHDADISTLQQNFQKIWDLFNASDKELKKNYGISRKDYPILNKSKYKLEDWSKTAEVDGQTVSVKNYLRLKLLDLDDYLDIYMYQMEPDNQNIAWIEPYPKDMAYLKWHRSIPKEMMFPLKKAKFCGKEVMVPNNTREYMELRYGNLAPSKVWDDKQQKYVNAENHEYNTPAHGAV